MSALRILFGTRLWRAIAGHALLLLLVVTLVTLAVVFVLVRNHDRSQAERQATTLLNLLSYSAESFMLRGSLQRQVTFVSATEGVESLVVVAGSPAKVVASNRLEEVGLGIERLTDPALRAQLQRQSLQGALQSQPIVHEFVGDSHVMTQAMVLHMQQDRPGGNPALMAIRVRTDATGWLGNRLFLVLVPVLFSLLLVGTLLALYYLRRRVLQPLQDVIRHVTGPRRGEPFTPIPVIYRDEIADAITEINQTFRALEEQKAEHRSLEQRMHGALTDTLQNLAYELHDTVGGYLGGLGFRAQSLATRLAGAGRPEAAAAEELFESIHQVGARVRQLSHTLSPTLADLGGLSTALLRLAEQLRDSIDAPVEVRVLDRLPQLEAWQVQHLYLIAQEAVRNIERHARASQATLVLDMHRDQLRLVVACTGHPWDPRHAQRGLGLRAMGYRAALLHARYRLRATRSGRTLLCCRVPTAAQLAALAV